ncbi:pyruvate dehydrogenase E1 component [Kineosphaera limosa]|uniref:Pyruvate dehydrogenase E1 component n=1 Tax=Kineosphaera limosa NBRC 100340 TaxID=1184609 RepID=K6VHF1_9MICO|nr:pyruvate dehydrogenase (acetyl-transferring), homodimeric type [Kineosphaera limosa]NYD99678.1 pyruvate dehydrogenase E1 component [Kineosphaera limosa]GAB95633.1 pyruvate dehydrogenase E1 component [Kineosphaera limosa NBRC 100340]
MENPEKNPLYGPDVDPEETAEWIESFEGLVSERGAERAREMLASLGARAAALGVAPEPKLTSDYVNTIPISQEPEYPGDEEAERQYSRWIRWNAAMIVQRAQRAHLSVGGHISTYAGASALYEVGQNHFFRGQDHPGGGDQVFLQGHASPGMYARAFMEGRLSQEQLDGFRQDRSAAPNGIPSYPHPRLMPEFWQFPTVSMGLGPMNAVYQAQFNRYLHNRGIKDTSDQHVWAFLGDGEMDEPESRGFLQLAANERLDNLTFVINCNLQRLDGPVRGNGKIVQELEGLFRGAGWNVVKVLWGREWDELIENDVDGSLVKIMNEIPDGDFQTYKGESGKYVREEFFGRSAGALKLVEDWSDEKIWSLRRGGHDYHKMYAAYAAATAHQGQPTVVLAHTVKGYGLGSNFEARNATHQMKKLTNADLKLFRDFLDVPLSDKELEDTYNVPYYHPGADNDAIKYMMQRRKELGGGVPQRRTKTRSLTVPPEKTYDGPRKGSGKQQAATTMAFVRLVRDLMRDKEFGKRIVPIIPDEARTFGMDSFFPTAKIYNPRGQTYKAVDRAQLLAYKESESGQLLHTGINEAGSTAAFTAVGTSYSTHGEPMVPIYIFYSMFGFQRTGDSFWAAMDQMARGFVIGATAGRTTLTGEGLQHADGHSPLLASTNPAIKSYDPAYGYEIAHIVRAGMEEMYGPQAKNVMYYITVYNEPILQPKEPEGIDVDGIVKGMYRLAEGSGDGPKVQLLASGVAVPWIIDAQQILEQDWGVSADIWSVTSWNELRRDALAAEKHAFLHPEEEARVPYVTATLGATQGPVVATSDYVSDLPDLIRQYVDKPFASLGADDHGFSDTRAAARRYFHIDSHSVVVRALQLLAQEGKVDADVPRQAADKYELLNVKAGKSGNAGGDA